MLALIGMAWAALGLLPPMLTNGQWMELRLLYAPWAGAALLCAAGLSALRSQQALRLGLLVVAGWSLFNMLGVAGMTRAYQWRWAMDQRQLAALQAAVPELPPVSPVWLWPADVDQRSIPNGQGGAVDEFLISVYEMSWATEGATRMLYRRPDVHAVTRNLSGSWQLSALERDIQGQVTALTLQHRHVPISKLIAFTWRDERLTLISPLRIHAGDEVIEIPLPLPETLAKERGLSLTAFEMRLTPAP